MIYKTPHRKPKIEQNERDKKKPGVNSGTPEVWAVIASLVVPVA